jgi:transketolase
MKPTSCREIYRDLLAELIVTSPRIWCVDTDTGLFDPRQWGQEPRYVNLGIAEQNAMGVAAGLAAAGGLPYVNTMAAFASTRAVEFVKLDIALANRPVRIVATHAGLSSGNLGPSHHALEDLAIMRTLLNLTVVVPADGPSTAAIVRQSVDWPGPLYLRLDRQPVPPLPGAPPPRIGVASLLRTGEDVTIAACGPMAVRAAVDAHDRLAADGIAVRVLDLHTVRPLDEAAVLAAAHETAGIVTVEDHWATGGLGSAVAELLAERRPARVYRVGVSNEDLWLAGSHEYLLARRGVSAAAVANRARQLLEEKPR